MPLNDDPDAFDFPIDDDGAVDFLIDEDEEPFDWDALNEAFGD